MNFVWVVGVLDCNDIHTRFGCDDRVDDIQVVIPLCHFRLQHVAADNGSVSFQIRQEE